MAVDSKVLAARIKAQVTGTSPRDKISAVSETVAKVGAELNLQKPNSYTHMDVAEIASLQDMQAAEEGVMDYSSDKAIMELQSQALSGVDVRDNNIGTVLKEHNKYNAGSLQNLADSFNNPTVSHTDLLGAAKSVKLTQGISKSDTFFEEPAKGVQSAMHRLKQKKALLALENPPMSDEAPVELGFAEFERFEDIPIPQTDADNASITDGMLDGYMLGIMFLPALINRIWDDQALVELDEFQSFLNQRAVKDPMYKRGLREGNILSYVLDPVGDATGYVAIKGLVSAYKTGKAGRTAVKTYNVLKKAVGSDGAVGIVSASNGLLRKYFTKLSTTQPKLLQKIIDETAGHSDKVAMRINRAIDDALNSAEKTMHEAAEDVLTSSGAHMARMADGDSTATQSLVEGVLMHTNPEPHVIQETLNKVFDTGDAKAITLLTDVPAGGVQFPRTAFGAQMNNATDIGTTTGNKIFYNVMQEKSQIVQNIHQLRVYKQDVSVGINADGWANHSPGHVSNAFLPPSQTFKGAAKKDFVITPTANLQETKRLQKAFSDDMKQVWKTLSNGEQNDLSKAVAMSNEGGFWLEPVQGGFRNPKTGDIVLRTNDNVKASYMARKRVMQDVRTLVNKEAGKQARSAGFKLAKIGDDEALAQLDKTIRPRTAQSGGDMVHRVEMAFDETGAAKGSPILGEAIEWSDELAENHEVWVLFKQAGDNDAGTRILVPKTQSQDIIRSIPENYQLYGKRDGYMHVQYTGKYAVTQIQKSKAGEIISVKRVAMSDSYRDGQELISKWDNPDKGLYHIVDKAERDQFDLAYSGAFVDELSTMTETQLVALRKKFIDEGMNPDMIDQFMASNKKYAFKYGDAMKRRSEEQLVDAKAILEGKTGAESVAGIRTAQEADALYLDWAARYTGESTHMVQLEEGFKKNYANVLTDPDDVFSPIKTSGVDNELAKEAKIYQQQMKKLAGRKSSDELYMDSVRENILNKMIHSANKKISWAGEFVDTVLPTYGGFFRGAKALTGTAKLSLFSVIQMPLQFSAGFLNVVGSQTGRLIFNGNRVETLKVMAGTQMDFIKYISPNILKATDVPGAKGARQVWDLVQRSGIDAGMDYEHLARLTADARNLNKLTSLLSRGAEKSGVFFQIGETMQQVYSFLGAKNALEAEIRAGKSTLKMSDIGARYSDAFLSEAMARGKILALNMSRVDAPGLLKSELGSTIGMFKQFGLKQGGLFNPWGKDLTKAEKAGLYVTWMGVYGGVGIPFGMDIAAGLEKGANFFTTEDNTGKLTMEIPYAVADDLARRMRRAGWKDANSDFIFRWMTQGADSAFTEGDIALGTRMAIGEYWSQFLQGPAMDEALLGAAYSTSKRLFAQDIPTTIDHFLVAIKDHDLSADDSFALALRATKQLSGPNAHLRAIQANRTGELRGTTGELFTDHPTLSEILQTAIGIQPGKVSERKAFQRIKYQKKQALMEWTKSKAKEISEVYTISSRLGDQLMDEARAELHDAGMEIVGVSLQKAIFNRHIQHQLPLSTRMRIESVGKFQLDEDLNQILDITLKDE